MSYSQVGALTSFSASTRVLSSQVNTNYNLIRDVVNALITGTNTIVADTIGEVTTAAGVTIDSVLLKDGGVTASGSCYIGDTANANVTLGLTINQGAADDQILALKSSDVTHGYTTGAETDTFYAISKYSATLGGAYSLALAEDAALSTVLQHAAIGGTADTTKSTAGRALVEVYVSEHNGSNALANITADGNVFGVRARVGGSDVMCWMVDEDGDTWQAGDVGLQSGASVRWGNGSPGSITASGVTLTLGSGGAISLAQPTTVSGTSGGYVLIEQATFTPYVLESRATGQVAHGLTGIMDTASWFQMNQASGGYGGTRLVVVGEDNAALSSVFVVQAYGGQADTTKTSAGLALMHLTAVEHDGANNQTDVTADGNVFGVSGRVGGVLRTLFLVDEDGDFHYDGADGGAFDSEDDAALVRAFALATSKDTIRSEFDEFVRYNEDDLVRLGILGDTVANGGLVNGAQLQRLLVGAVWQQQAAIEALRSEIRALRA